MICEMCGVDVPRLRRIVIEGSTLEVCTKCEKFGQDYEEVKDREGIVGRDTIAERLERREKRLRGRDVLEKSEKDLLALKKFGRKSVEELQQHLEGMGLSLRSEKEDET